MDDINDTGGRASAEKRLRGTRAYAGSGPLIWIIKTDSKRKESTPMEMEFSILMNL